MVVKMYIHALFGYKLHADKRRCKASGKVEMSNFMNISSVKCFHKMQELMERLH